MVERLKKIRIREEDLEGLLEWAKKSPTEVAALLFGRIEGNEAEVTSFRRTENVEESAFHFLVNPEFLYRSYEEAEARGEELVGIFHSHPASHQPSGRDKRFMELNPVVWVIASSINSKYGAHQLVGDELYPVELKVT